MEINDDHAEMSVQGSLFALEKSFALNHDWILCEITDGLIPWKKINDNVCHVNCDATSFRHILSVLTRSDDASSVKDLSPTDYKLLQRTVDYLMINDSNLNSAIDDYPMKAEKDRLLEKLEKKSVRYDQLMAKFNKLKTEKDEVVDDLKWSYNELKMSYDELEMRHDELWEDYDELKTKKK